MFLMYTQALNHRIKDAEAAARAQADAATGDMQIARERHESEARAWAFERITMETRLGKLQQQAAADAASALAALDSAKAQVCSSHHVCSLHFYQSAPHPPHLQISELVREVASLQRPVCCDMSEQTDAFEGELTLAPSFIACVIHQTAIIQF